MRLQTLLVLFLITLFYVNLAAAENLLITLKTRPLLSELKLQRASVGLDPSKLDVSVPPAHRSTISKALRSHASRLKQYRTEISEQIRTRFPTVKHIASYENSISGIAISVPEQLSSAVKHYLRNIPNVKTVSSLPAIRPALQSSVPSISADIIRQYTDSSGRALTGEDVKIAIIDMGIDIAHPQFGGECLFTSDADCKVVGGWDYCDMDEDPREDSQPWNFDGHGTFVASVAAGSSGVAPDASLLAYRVMSTVGTMCRAGSLVNSAAAILDVLDSKLVSISSNGTCTPNADIVNMSFIIAGGSQEAYAVLDQTEQAIEAATDCGVLFVAAAGNWSREYRTVNAPANFRSVLGVGSIDHRNDELQNYENFLFSGLGPREERGELLSKPDVVAPGVDICAALAVPSRWERESAADFFPACFDGGEGQTVRGTGTSFASPHVAGLAALLKQAYPNLSPRDLKQLIEQSSIPIAHLNTAQAGHGKVDALRALAQSVVLKLDKDFYDAAQQNSIVLAHRHLLPHGPIGLRIHQASFKHLPIEDSTIAASSFSGTFQVIGTRDFCLLPSDTASSSILPGVLSVVEGSAFEVSLALNTAYQGDYLTKLELEYFEDCTFSNSQLETTLPTIIRELRQTVIGDLTGDRVVNSLDLSFVLNAWGTDNVMADLNGDGTVNGPDLAVILSNWG